MKKSYQMFLTVFVLALTVMIGSATRSKAAVNMGLKQTDAGSSSVTLSWNAYLGGSGNVHYHVMFSNDGANWTDMGRSSTPSDYIYNLGEGATYYAKIVVYGGYHSTSELAVNESESIQVCTSLPETKDLKQTSAAINSISMSWAPVAGAEGYEVYAYMGGNWTKVATSNTTSATVNGIGASNEFMYAVNAFRSVTGGVVYGRRSDSVRMKTIPAKVSYVSMTNYWQYLKSASYGWNSVNNADGYQFQLLNHKGKSLLTRETSSSYISVDPFKAGIFTKARVRAYIVVNNKKYYGAWSGYSYNAANKKITLKRSANRKKITLKWKKISGCAGYTVYISTKSNSGFKKVKTLSSKKTSISITKCGKKKLKKNKTYYIRVKYLTKVGKKKVASNVMGTGSI